MKRMSYSLETKYKAAEMKENEYKTKEIMETSNIKNQPQAKT